MADPAANNENDFKERKLQNVKYWITEYWIAIAEEILTINGIKHDTMIFILWKEF